MFGFKLNYYAILLVERQLQLIKKVFILFVQKRVVEGIYGNRMYVFVSLLS